MDEDDPMYEVVRKGNEKEQSQIDENSHDGPSFLYNNQDIATTNDKASATNYIEQKPGEEALEEMYAVVNKKLKVEKEEGDPSRPPHVINEYHSIQAVEKDPKSDATVEGEEASPIPHNRVEELYTVVKKSLKENEKEKVAPPLPPHTVEELYTAVVKKPKGNAEDEDKAPPIPPHSVEEEYTAVNRNLKNNPENDSEEVAPPIPPYTVEELYTAVVKKPKESVTNDGEEAPPIPPYTVDKLSCSSGNDRSDHKDEDNIS
jgi:hypothetical protein